MKKFADKIQHWFWGLGMALFFGLMLGWEGYLLSILLMGAKEVVWDKLLKKGCPDIWDFIWGTGGILCGVLIVRMIS